MPNYFQVIDLDRTLFDTPRFVRALTERIDRDEPGVGRHLYEQMEAAYKAGETFFLLRHLRQVNGDVWFEQLVASVIEEHGAEAFMLPGARGRIQIADSLSSARPSWGILTYGDDIDQRMKLAIAGLAGVPAIITQTEVKGTVIRSWQQPDGTFKLPEAYGGGVVDTVTLEDDKLRAFYDLPENASGIWLTEDETAVEQVQVAGLANVVVSRSLHESIALLSDASTITV